MFTPFVLMAFLRLVRFNFNRLLTRNQNKKQQFFIQFYTKNQSLSYRRKKNEQNFSTWASALWNVCYLLFQSIFKRCSNFNLLTQFHNHFILSANWCFQKNCLFRFINEFSSKINSFTEKLRIKSKSYHSLFNWFSIRFLHKK